MTAGWLITFVRWRSSILVWALWNSVHGLAFLKAKILSTLNQQFNNGQLALIDNNCFSKQSRITIFQELCYNYL